MTPILSLPALLVVSMLGHGTFEIDAGYYGNCIGLRDYILTSPLITMAECRVRRQ